MRRLRAARGAGLAGRVVGMRAAPPGHVAGERPRAGGQRQGEALLQQAALPREGGGRRRGSRTGRRRRLLLPVRGAGAVARRLHEPRAEDPLHALALQQRARAPRPAGPAPASAASRRRPGQLPPAGPAAPPRAPAARARLRGGARRGGAAQPRQHLLHERHPAVPQQHRAVRRVPGVGAVPRPRGARPAAPRTRRGDGAAGAAGAGALDAGIHPAAQPRLQGEAGRAAVARPCASARRERASGLGAVRWPGRCRASASRCEEPAPEARRRRAASHVPGRG